MRITRLTAILVLIATLIVVTISCAMCGNTPARVGQDAASPVRGASGQSSANLTEINDAPAPPVMTEVLGGDDTSAARDLQRRTELPLRTVPYVDVKRYMGRWYEIARLPNPYQDGVVGVIAEYSQKEDGEILVRNLGRSGSLDADLTSSTADAWVVDESTNAKWHVQFVWPFKADYWIIDLDEAYRYAVVGQPERERLWILSRTPTLPDDTLTAIYDRLRSNGYDPGQIERTPQRPSK